MDNFLKRLKPVGIIFIASFFIASGITFLQKRGKAPLPALPEKTAEVFVVGEPVSLIANGGFEEGINVVNEGFERDFEGWERGGELAQSISTADKISGSKSALLGDPNYQDRSIPVGSSRIWRTVSVPSSDTPKLSFFYRVITYDSVWGSETSKFHDAFEIYINNVDWQALKQPDAGDLRRLNLCRNNLGVPDTSSAGLVFCDGGVVPRTFEDPGWKHVILDLSAFKGQTITLYLANFSREYFSPYINNQGWYNTYIYIDSFSGIPPWSLENKGIKELAADRGGKVLHEKGRTNETARVIQWPVIEAGKTYTLSLAFKGSGGNDKAGVNGYDSAYIKADEWCNGGAAGNTFKQGYRFNDRAYSIWQTKSWTFTAANCNADQDHRLAVYFDTSNNGEVFVDDVSLQEGSASSTPTPTPTRTPTPAPTRTPIPTRTPTPVLTRTPTPTGVTLIPTGTSAPTLTPASCSRKAEGDANCEGRISGIDYSLWLNSQCRRTAAQSCASDKADFNADGNTDDSDYNIWFNNRGTFLLE